MTELKTTFDKTPPLPVPEDLGLWPVEILPLLVEWADRTVEWKQWAMINISVELHIYIL